MDSNILKLKEILERDALLNSPKRVAYNKTEDKPCELIRSILKSPLGYQKSETDVGGGSKLIRPQQITEPSIETQKIPQLPSFTLRIGKRVSISQEDINVNQSMDIKVTERSENQYTYDTVILNPPISKQSEAILKHLDKKSMNNSQVKGVTKKWIEEAKSIKGSELDVLSQDEFDVSLKRPYYLKKLEKEMTTVYGEGSTRRLRPGEEATILAVTEDFISSLLEATNIPNLRLSNFREKILTLAGLEDLNEYPFCLRQV